MGFKDGFLKTWRKRNSFERALTVLSAVCLFAAVILIALQLFGIWEFALSVAVLLLVIELVLRGAICFRTERSIAFVYFGGACGMLVIYLLKLIK